VGLLAMTAWAGSGPPDTGPDKVHLWPGFDRAAAVTNLKVEFDSMDEFYKKYADHLTDTRSGDDYGRALANLTFGEIKNDPASISRARTLFAEEDTAVKQPEEKKLAELGEGYSDELLSGQYPTAGAATDKVVPVVIDKYPPPTKDFHRIILGRSVIKVAKGALVKTQVDRVIRDWQLGRNVDAAPWDYVKDKLVPWHEGQKVRELVDLADVRVVPVWGTKARKIGGRWYAPDASGAYRFEIMPDKICDYPTTIPLDDRTVIMNDTHGIAAIASQCLDADLALGCGDFPGKTDAAFYLASKGVNVYMPTDRYNGLLIGARTKGTIIGSAPIRKSGDGAMIGGQPVSFDVNEKIVVCNSHAGYPLRYYDTPYRFFTCLQDYIGQPLKIIPVEVTEYGKSDVVVDEARRQGAKLIGIRVKTKFSHDAVAAWLKEDKDHRAILFHTSVYPDGYRLFFEFPQQTSFGDILPQFE
jgi:hypothetical protein